MQTFHDLGLSKPLLKAIEALGFQSPTPIQEQAIPLLLEHKKDLLALAQTGTGKTAAFGLPLIQLVNAGNNETQALVLAPTRELCVQITNDLQKYALHSGRINIVAVYGGANIRTQITEIRRGAQIIVATPGRLIDLLSRKIVKINSIQYLVLDEADEMLNMGFQEDIDIILETTPKEKSVWLFSATMPQEIKRITKKYMQDPDEITVGKANTGNINIDHQYYLVNGRDKYPALKRILDFNPEIFGIIFCRTKLETQEVADDLIKNGYNADSLHGDLSQVQRDKVMASFRSRALQILVATDVAARGIDVDDVTHIIHLHLPDDIEFYTHRSGRTARAGKSGISMVLVTEKDLYKIKHLEKKLSTTFTKMKVPTGIEVCEKQLLALIHRVHDVEVNEKEIAPYLSFIEEEFADMSKTEILTRFASLEFNRFLEYYRFAKDLNIDERRSRDHERSATSKGNNDLFFINLGKMDGLGDRDMIELITKATRIKGKEISGLRLKGAYSFFEAPKTYSELIIQSFRGVSYQGRRVRVEIQNEREAFPKKKKHGGSSRDMKRR